MEKEMGKRTGRKHYRFVSGRMRHLILSVTEPESLLSLSLHPDKLVDKSSEILYLVVEKKTTTTELSSVKSRS